MDERFGSGNDFAIGVEEELLLVDAATHALSHSSTEVIPRVGEGAKHDLYEAQLELISQPAADAAAAVAELRRLRARVAEVGGTLIGAGIHPAAVFGDVRIVDADRYERELKNLRGIVQRTPDCALHVHVGMPDRETAIRVYNGLREQLPLLVALSGNSAFWHGLDSGFDCTRMVLRRAYPRTEVPPAFDDWAHYQRTVAAVLDAGQVTDYTFLWWDVRPHPKLGTVELRVMDAQASAEAVEALADLAHGLALHYASAAPVAPTPREALAESAFRATRDGLRAWLWSGGELRPVKELAKEAVELAGRGGGVLSWLEGGNGADRQRAAFARGGMEAVLADLVSTTSCV